MQDFFYSVKLSLFVYVRSEEKKRRFVHHRIYFDLYLKII